MNTLTIPQIAEEIRHHLATDNFAPKLIVDHIMPVLGFTLDTPEEMKEAALSSDLISDTVDDLKTIEEHIRQDINLVVHKLNDLHTTLNQTEDMENEASCLLNMIEEVDDLRKYARQIRDTAEGLSV